LAGKKEAKYLDVFFSFFILNASDMSSITVFLKGPILLKKK